MSLIGPRPILCNQYNLIDEKDKYGANDLSVGLQYSLSLVEEMIFLWILNVSWEL